MLAITLCMWLSFATAEPNSKPYIPFRTDPKDHPFVKHVIDWTDRRSNRARAQVKEYNVVKESVDKERCPLQFTLGVSRRAHHKAQNSKAFSIVKPPIIHPIFPARGPGRQLIHTTLYEHFDLLSPELAGPDASSASNNVIKEGLIQHQEFPMLFESSSFAYTSPIIHDVNGDGIPDAILSDYDGGIYIVGLHQGKEGKRWFHKAQVPRIFIRRSWVEARVNETHKELYPENPDEHQEAEVEEGKKNDGSVSRDPYHSYFEYSSGNYGGKDVLRGVTANVLGQKRDDLDALKDRRSQKLGPKEEEEGGVEREAESNGEGEGEAGEGEGEGEEAPRRRLLEVEVFEDDDVQQVTFPRRRLQEVSEEEAARRREEEQRRDQERIENERREQQQREEEERRRREEQEQREREEQERRQREEDETRQREEQERRDREDNERREREEQERRQREDEERRQREEQEGQDREENERREREENERREREEQERRQREEEERQRAEQERVAEEQRQHEQAQVDGQPPQEQQQEQVQHEGEVQNPEQNAGDQNEGEGGEDGEGEESYSRSGRDDDAADAGPRGDDEYPSGNGDDEYPDYGYGGGGDDMYGGPSGGYDDYYGRYKSYRDDYYDEKHYVRVNPHILSTPTLAEIPKLYGNDDEVEDMLFVPVSYFLDEDEYEGHFSYKRFDNTDAGDETEVKRGMYVASAIMIYQLGNDPRWGRQEHLDLSSDHSSPQNVTLLGKIPVKEDNTRMGAFALSRPAVADIDGDGKLEVLIGTSMGIVYCFDATHMTMKNSWPIQMQHAVESPIVVEDIAANTKLEVLVSDIGGNVACFDEDANKVWHRDFRASVCDGPCTVRASSHISLGDIDGDGTLDVTIALQIRSEEKKSETTYVFALNGATGDDLQNFPLAFETPASLRSKPQEDWVHQQLPGLLLVDLHEDQSHMTDYIRRNGTKWTRRERSSSKPGGGSAPGLHVVLAVGETLYIIEAGSGCIQNFGVGEEVFAQVQVDDVHGTNNLDLVVSTTSGNIITMESSAPYHPLNVWNNGEFRGRYNNHAHGYSASQGVFVHSMSREYRDIFGVFVPVTFEIFDNRPNILFETEKKIYKVEIRDGTSTKRAIWRNTYNETGVYTERLYIPHGAGYYALTVQMRTTNGLIYEDMFHIGYNVNYMDGFGLMLWLPLLLAAITIFLGSSRNIRWDDEDYKSQDRNGGGLGILG